MKTMIFSLIAIVELLLVGLQHQQLRELRNENATLKQASAEANQLKGDLDKSTGDQAQDEEEIARLREENHDLLKLRNEVNQLRDARVQFEKISAENQRLVSLAKNAAKTESKQSVQPIVVRMDSLINRGTSTPEDALQTFYWAQRERNSEVFSRSVTQRSWNNFKNYLDGWRRQNLDGILSIEIVARRDVDATTVQMGIQLHNAGNPEYGQKLIFVLVLQGNEWRVDSASY
ncbi:MAG TPA: hypothetical protein VHC44_02605 [Verrucomicrobiae bacterium]|nr:hypothetical protein [Verrucomicrobiae bacterium]